MSYETGKVRSDCQSHNNRSRIIHPYRPLLLVGCLAVCLFSVKTLFSLIDFTLMTLNGRVYPTLTLTLTLGFTYSTVQKS